MPHRLASWPLLVLLMAPIAPAQGQAQARAQGQPAVSTADAQALASQLDLWLTLVTVGALPSAGLPVAVTPDAGRAQISVPLGKPGTVTPPGAALTAIATRSGPTTWALAGQELPDRFSIKSSEIVADAVDSKNPHPAGHHTVPVTTTVTLSGQDGHGSFDTAGQLASSYAAHFAHTRITKQGGATPTESSIAAISYDFTTTPSDATHFDFMQNAVATDYAGTTSLPGGSVVSVKAAALRANSVLTGLAGAKFAALLAQLPALRTMMGGASAAGDEPTPVQRAQIHTLIETARNAFTGLAITEAADRFSFEVDAIKGSADHASLTLAGAAPQDMLSGEVGLVLDGLAAPSLPPGMAAYLPTHVALHPTFANLDLAALTRYALAASAPAKPGQSDAMAPPDPQILFGKGGIDIGFTQLDLTVAGAQLTGQGAFKLASVDAIDGKAEFRATGLDPVIAKLQQDPSMTQVLPVIIFLKGIAHAEGGASVWQVSVHDTDVLVNGIDLSALAGAGK